MEKIIQESVQRNLKPNQIRTKCLSTRDLCLEDFVLLRNHLKYKEGWEYVFEKEYLEFWTYVKGYKYKKINAADLITLCGKFRAKQIIDCSM